MYYIIRRIDQGGGYVTPAGSPRSYTKDRSKARRYETHLEASRDRCKDNERVERVGG